MSGNDKLGINQGSKVVTDEIITGNYQTISNGLQVRFGASTTIGTSGATANLMDASATIHDVYEIEAFAVGEEIQDSRGIKSAYMTRA